MSVRTVLPRALQLIHLEISCFNFDFILFKYAQKTSMCFALEMYSIFCNALYSLQQNFKFPSTSY